MAYEEIKIEKAIPMPLGVGRGKGTALKYPWSTMEIGDSFLLPSKLKSPASCPHTRNTYEAAVGSPKRFRGRKTVDGFRVWRVS